MFLKISQYSQDNSCVGGGGLAHNFIEKRLQHRCFPKNIEKFLRIAFLTEAFWWLLLLFSAICSLNFLQSKGRKRKTLWRENTKSLVSCFAIIFFYKISVGESRAPSATSKQKRGSVKSGVSKVLFPGIGKITNPKVK